MRNPTSECPAPKSGLSSSNRERYYLAGALLVAVAVRFYLFKHYYTINNDGVLYIQVARHFWEGEWLRGLGSFYPPLFPLLIAAVYPVIGKWELAGQFWPLLLGVLVVFPLFGLLRRLYGCRAALLAVYFYGLSPYLARLSLHVRSEMPYIFFLVLTVYCLQLGFDRGKGPPFFLAGVNTALAYLVRSEGLGLLIVGLLCLLYRGWVKGHWGRRWAQMGVFCLGFVLLSAPYISYLRWDTGKWLVSRKAGLILSLALADYDPTVKVVSMKDSAQASALDLVASRPFLYGKKVFYDTFRSLGVYLEAVHYSYLPFLFVGWFLVFRVRFWEREDFFLIGVVFFYLLAFAFLYVNRRYAVPLVPLSLGWVAAGFLAFHETSCRWFGRRGHLVTGIIVALFLAGTLPKTLKAIGREKLYLRQAGLYFKRLGDEPVILTTNGRVAFYAGGQNRVLVIGLQDLEGFPSTLRGDYLAVDGEIVDGIGGSIEEHGWSLKRTFTGGKGNVLYIYERAS